MRILIAAITISSAILSLAFIPAYERTDFSGKWELNISKTVAEYGQQRITAKTLQVEQSKDTLKITTTFRGKQESAAYALNGKEFEFVRGDTKIRSTATWSPNGKELSISFISFINDRPTGGESLQTWQIKDGSLYISTVSGGRSQMTRGEIYDK